jgi:Kef-type K+ transport system membrane component KefB
VAQSTPGSASRTLMLTVAYVLGVVLLVRPWVVRWVRGQELRQRLSPRAIATAFVALLLSALATEMIGIHALFGAFILGAIVPHDSLLARALKARLEDVVVVLLLPMFFAFTGMRTEIGLVSGVGDWAICGALLVIAVAGKFGGSTVAARLSGLGWRDSASVGVLMNTRGLMELIVLNVGLDLKVISPTLFAMLVIMALVTTLATAPLLHVLTADRSLESPAEVDAAH